MLNEFVERVYPSLDIQALLKDEIIEVEEPSKKCSENLDDELKELKSGKRIWYTFEMQTPGVIFIKLIEPMRQHIDVNVLMLAILKHIKEGNVLTRFACRMLPIFSL